MLKLIETLSVDNSDIPRFLKVPRDVYDLACPHCQTVMQEKDFRFGFDNDKKLWYHLCDGRNKKFFRPTEEMEKTAKEAAAFFKSRFS